jgi:purine-binding chemotaxis protein CheW
MRPVVDRTLPGADLDATQRILAERAHALAQPLLADEPADTVEMIVMILGRERYGVDTRCVKEILGLADLAPVPGTPAFWRGIVNVRGTLYPVLDLRQFLSLPADDADEGQGTVVLVAGGGLTVGLVVDHVPGVRRIPAAAIRTLVLAGAPDTDRGSMRGVTDDLLTVLDVDALLANPRLAVREDPA